MAWKSCEVADMGVKGDGGDGGVWIFRRGLKMREGILHQAL